MEPPRYRVLAAEKFKGNLAYFFNTRKSHVLCVEQEKRSAQVPLPSLKFFIYDLENEEVLFEEDIENGRVQWLNENEVQLTRIPGTITSGHAQNDNIYVYNVRTRKKSEITNRSRRDIRN